MSIYQSMINPRDAEQQQRTRRELLDEVLQLYEVHARHVQSSVFRCDAACVPGMRNVHEHLCMAGIMAWPPVPPVRVCQRHRRLFFDASDNAQRQLAQAYVDAFPLDESDPTTHDRCDAGCPLLSVAHVLHHAKKATLPWLPVYVCATHSTMHACCAAPNGAPMLCDNRGGSNTRMCNACCAGRLCYERCPVNLNAIDRHGGHQCLFSAVLTSYLSDGDLARLCGWSATSTGETFKMPRKRRVAASESAAVVARLDAMRRWMAHALRQGRRARDAAAAATTAQSLVPRAEAEERVIAMLIESGVRTEDGAFVLMPRDVWQFAPLMHASYHQPLAPACPPDDTPTEHAACDALLFAFDRFFQHRMPALSMLQRIAAPDSTIGAIRASDLLRTYAALMACFVPPGGVPVVTLPDRFSDGEAAAAAEWVASARTDDERAAAIAAAAAAAEALPMRLRAEALKNHAAFFL